MLGTAPSVDFAQKVFYLFDIRLTDSSVHDLLIDHAKGVLLLYLVDDGVFLILSVLCLVLEVVLEVVDVFRVCIARPPAVVLVFLPRAPLLGKADLFCNDFIFDNFGLNGGTGSLHAQA